VGALLLSLTNGFCGEVLVFQILGFSASEGSQRGQKSKLLYVIMSEGVGKRYITLMAALVLNAVNCYGRLKSEVLQ